MGREGRTERRRPRQRPRDATCGGSAAANPLPYGTLGTLTVSPAGRDNRGESRRTGRCFQRSTTKKEHRCRP